MTTQTFLNGRVTLMGGDCLDVLRTMPDASVDSVVTDPPYALTNNSGSRSLIPGQYTPIGRPSEPRGGFMGKAWDTGERAFTQELWSEVLRVLKPGGHLLAFGGTRTYHRLVCAIEDAGFEIRDMISDLIASDTHVAQFMASLSAEQQAAFVRCIDESQFGGMLAWTYGSGFPKSHNIAKALDSTLGKQGKGFNTAGQGIGLNSRRELRSDHPDYVSYTPATDAARRWEGWGSALKPALEPICVARKPLVGTLAENVLQHGTGGLNVDATRISTSRDDAHNSPADSTVCTCHVRAASQTVHNADTHSVGLSKPFGEHTTPNVEAQYIPNGKNTVYGTNMGGGDWNPSAKGRWPANLVHDGSEEVLGVFPETTSSPVPAGTKDNGKTAGTYGAFGGRTFSREYPGNSGSAARFFYQSKADSNDRLGSKHPTVKPLDLMQWLVRLVTPPGGLVLDPFAGTGTTGEAAWREGMHAVLIEREPEYQADIARRMALALSGPDERRRETIKEKLKGQPQDAGPLFGGM